jgi:nucleoside-diphosphate-sugar epimerase
VGTVLVTGAFGLVGTETVARLNERGATVVVTDLGTSNNRKAAQRLPSGVEARWVDLTDESQVEQLLAEVAPTTIIHLAAVIPTACYENAGVARRVNVEATLLLVNAAERMSTRPRFVQASSVAVHGSRNPHRYGLLNDDSPLAPVDSYGAQKLAAEQIVRGSGLDWTILRLGAVVSVRLRSLPISSKVLFLEWAMPSDGRINTVDVRDVATAFAEAATADVVGETLMIGGDESHHQLQGEVGPAIAAAMGLADCYPRGRTGDPNDDKAWFVCDWMDTARAQDALNFQHHSWPAMLDEIRDRVGWGRYLLAAVSPVARIALKQRMPYRGIPGEYADPWRLVMQRWPGAAPE